MQLLHSAAYHVVGLKQHISVCTLDSFAFVTLITQPQHNAVLLAAKMHKTSEVVCCYRRSLLLQCCVAALWSIL